MAYRNKTYVCFASEDIHNYRMMEAWRENANINFDFYDAHDLKLLRPTSQPETVRRSLRDRLANTKQAVLLVGDITRSKAANSDTFLYYEMDVVTRLKLPLVIVNLNQSRVAEPKRIPAALGGHYTMSVSYQPKIVMEALDDYVTKFNANLTATNPKTGPYHYNASVYTRLGL